MATLSRFLATSVVIATGFSFLAAANAQTTTSPSATPPGASSKSTGISDKKLDAAAAAAKKVVVLNQSYKEKLDKASGAQKQQLNDEANQAMTRAVNEQGLSVDE